MGDLAERLAEELNVETVFDVPFFGGISESVVVTWIIMAVVLVASILLTRNLKVENPSRRQLMVEEVVTKLQGAVVNIVGEHGKAYAPYLTSILIYIGIANVVGILGFKPPTKDLNVTIALAAFSIFIIEFAGIHKKGVGKWLKSFTEPMVVITPIKILEVFTTPLSQCMRLFGNVLGAFVVMKLIEFVLPVGLPIAFSFYFDLFDGLIQAYVFVFLTGLFIGEQLE